MESRETYRSIIMEASKMGAAEAVKYLKPEKDRISKRQAEKEFSWAWIKNKLEKGQILAERTGNKKNSTMYFSRSQLISLQSSERIEETILKESVNCVTNKYLKR